MECLITQPTHDVYGDKVFKMVTKVTKFQRLYIWIVFHNFLHFSLDIKLSQVLDFLMNIGFLNEPGFRYGNFFIPRVEKKPSKISQWEETLSSQGLILISIPETHGPFGNCIPVRLNQALFLFKRKYLLHFDKFFYGCAIFYEILQKKLKTCQIEAV